MSCTLAFQALEASTVALQIAPASIDHEELRVTTGPNHEPLSVDEVAGPHGARLHLVDVPAGEFIVRYSATVTPQSAAEPIEPVAFHDHEVITALHPSRYCPSDLLMAFAHREFEPVLGRDAGSEPVDLADAVASWVFDRLVYQLGSSGPCDSAVDTLLAGQGVCRDFSHLTIALCRALGVPARMVSVYAPGLTPMDFHAVVEVWRAGRWYVVDPARLAPRATLVRIATGRDAADTSFSSTLRGNVELLWCEVSAYTDSDLPIDDHHLPMVLSSP